jgi:starch synthase (maltosyl-transferring)
VDDENIMAFSKRRVLPDGTDDVVVVIANLDPHSTRESMMRLSMPALGLDYQEGMVAEDLITGSTWQWGEHVYVRVGPETEPVHIVAIRRF